MALLASAVAAVHATVVLFVLTGALLALRWPRLVLLHAPVALVVLGLNLAGADCPLTTLELALRASAGLPRYTGGFIGHHALAPLGLAVHDPAVQVALRVLVLAPNAVGYGLLVVHRVRRRVRPAGR